MKKTAKLAVVVMAAAALTIAYLATFDRQAGLRQTARCLRYAPRVTACFGKADFDFTADLEGLRYQGNTRDFIDRHIFYLGAFEKPMVTFLRGVLVSIYGGQGVFVDVGANTGLYSMLMSRHARQVHAFEPYEPVLRRFRHMVELNHLDNIVIHPVALGNENARQRFYRPGPSNQGTGSFIEGWTPANTAFDELEIQVGDEALARAGVAAVAVVKMDIEGYEKPALQGLARTLARDRPIVMFELTTDPQNAISIKSRQELEGLFPDRYDFLYFEAGSDPFTGRYALAGIDGAVRFDRHAQQDLVAIPAEKRGLIVTRGGGGGRT